MPRSSMTGTQKKAQRKLAKMEPEFAKEYLRNVKSQGSFARTSRRDVNDIAKGRGMPLYEPSAEYEPSKYKQQTKYQPDKFKQQTKYDTSTLKNLTRDFERAGKGAEKIFAPIKEQALAEFQQNTAPQIQNALGSAVKGSSALNQAMAAAGGNLQRGLASDFAGLQANLANSLLGQREQSRQFGAQFGAQGEQFGAQLRNQQQQFGSQFGAQGEQFGADLRNQQQQFGSQFYNQQQQYGHQSAMQALNARLQAAGANLGQQVIPQNTGAFASPYMQSAGQKSPSIGARIGSSILQGAIGGVGGLLTGGPPGAVVGAIGGGIHGGAQPGFF